MLGSRTRLRRAVFWEESLGEPPTAVVGNSPESGPCRSAPGGGYRGASSRGGVWPLGTAAWAVRGIDPPMATLDLVETQSPVHALPQVTVLDRDHLPERFPPPAIPPPFGQPKPDALSNVETRCHQRDPRGLIQGLQPPHHGQQLQAFPPNLRFHIVGDHTLRPVRRSQHESPPPGLGRLTRLREQQVVRRRKAHRGIVGDKSGERRPVRPPPLAGRFPHRFCWSVPSLHTSNLPRLSVRSCALPEV